MRLELGVPRSARLTEGDLGGLHLLFEFGGLVHVVGDSRLLHARLELGDALLCPAHGLRRLVASDARAGTRLVHEVDGLIGQKAVLDVARREARRRLECGRGVAHLVVLLVLGRELCQDRHRVLDARLIHINRLETALESRILGKVLAELLGRGGTDDLEGTTGEHRLEHGARVDGALGRAGADEGVHLVDEQDDVVGLGGLGDHVLEALLELTAVLGAGDEPGQVERPDVLVHEILGHVARRDLLCQPLDNRGLTHTRIAQDKRVVFGSAGQDLHHTGNLLFAADDRVELAGAGLFCEIRAELLERAFGLTAHLPLRTSAKKRQPRTRATGSGSGKGALFALVV